MEENITLENWQPTLQKSQLIPSKWRLKIVKNNPNQHPDKNELLKIRRYIKRRVSDCEIMTAFGLSAETMIAIKKNNYDPIEGVGMDSQYKIIREFKEINFKIEALYRGMHFIASKIFTEKEQMDEFRKELRRERRNSVNVDQNDRKDIHE